MAESIPGILALVFGALIMFDAGLIFAAYIYSRFIFNRYLMIHHRQKWEQLVYTGEYQGLNWFSFDKTPQLRKFRCDSEEDFGDQVIRRMRKISIYLFKTGIVAWVSLLVIFLMFVVGYVVVGQRG